MHIRELSSIRGIAAVVVLFGHVFYVVNRTGGTVMDMIFDFLGRSFNGPAAVEIFFVLSGLVLSLSLDKRADGKFATTLAFYIRRIFRIFPALWVSLTLVLLLLHFERSGCAAGFCTDWAAGAFQDDYTLKRIILAFLCIYVHLNGPMWTLRAELFYSFLFPGMFWLLWNRKTRWISFFIILVLAVSPIPRFYSVHYALAFALGSVIPHIRIKAKNFPYGMLALFALAVLIFSRQIFSSFRLEEKTFETVEMLAAAVIIFSIFNKKVSLGFLRGDALFYVGEISYSIYVLHYPLLFALLYPMARIAGPEFIRAYPNLFTVMLGAATFAATLGLAALNFRYVEVPFQSLGHRLSRRVLRRSKT